MTRILRWLLVRPLAVVLLGAVLAAAWVGWQFQRDPVAEAARASASYRIEPREPVAVTRDGEARVEHEVMLVGDDGRAAVPITVSVPRDATGPMPILLILGGLRAGRDSLKRLPALGPNVAVAFEYPYADGILDKGRSLLARAALVRRSAIEAPGAVVAALDWVRAQSWADANRTSLLGYSLGAVLVPAVHHRATVTGKPLGPSIMAFGGAEIGLIVPHVLRREGALVRKAAGQLAAVWLRPIEPALFLPHLKGEFLVVTAEDDELVPDRSGQLMAALTPEPKTVLSVPGAHLDPRDPAVLSRVVRLSRTWLLERGAINPSP